MTNVMKIYDALYPILYPIEEQDVNIQAEHVEIVMKCAEAAHKKFIDQHLGTEQDIAVSNIPMIEGFVIYRTSDKTFFTGRYPAWGKKPKIWKAIGHVKAHLTGNAVHRHWGSDVVTISKEYRDCVVINMGTQKPHPDFDIMKYSKLKAEEEAKRYGYQIEYEK
jgi:hypothetical protein